MAKGLYERWRTPEALALIEGWKRNGLSDGQVAKNMRISRSTLNEWRVRFPDIADALKKGREVVISEVENALVRRALGYTYQETTRELQFNRVTGKQELVITKQVEKAVPPDVGAIAFYLKNVAPDKWRDRQELQVGSLKEEQSILRETLEQLGMEEQ